MATQTVSHDHTMAYLLVATVIVLVIAVGGVWFFAS
jgi:hypothetical protein